MPFNHIWIGQIDGDRYENYFVNQPFRDGGKLSYNEFAQDQGETVLDYDVVEISYPNEQLEVREFVGMHLTPRRTWIKLLQRPCASVWRRSTHSSSRTKTSSRTPDQLSVTAFDWNTLGSSSTSNPLIRVKHARGIPEHRYDGYNEAGHNQELAMTIRLPDEIRNAFTAHPGVPLEVLDDQTRTAYVVMPMQVFREMMGVGSEAEYQESLAAIREGLADVEAGRTISADEFFRDLDRRYGIRS